MDAKYNWWGSNANPTSKIYGNVNVTPWIVLNLTLLYGDYLMSDLYLKYSKTGEQYPFDGIKELYRSIVL